ncbi:MAG TPA: hypothetical protein DCM08_12720 [Microscillaceae bacterium]|nr:hypothetical protein [Microscillaceae bacterium]
MYMKKILIWTGVLSFYFFPAKVKIFAQSMPRVELPSNHYHLRYETLPTAAGGVLVLKKPVYRQNQLEVQYFDSLLLNQWSLDFEMDYAQHVVHYLHDQTLYLLIQQYNRFEYKLIQVHLPDGKAFEQPIFSIKQIEVEQFTASADGLYVLGRTKNTRLFYYIDLQTLQSKVIPLGLAPNSQILRLSFDANYGNHLLTALEIQPDWSRSLVIYMLDKGIKTLALRVPSDDAHDFLSAEILSEPLRPMVVVGAYKHPRDGYAQGIYWVEINLNTLQQGIRYIPFVRLPHFFDFLPANAKQRQLGKLAQQNELVAARWRSPFQAQVYQLAHHKQAYWLAVEFSVVENKREMQGSGLFQTVLAHRYHHALLVKLSDKGELLEDSFLPMNDVGSLLPQRNLATTIETDKVMAMYVNQTHLHSSLHQLGVFSSTLVEQIPLAEALGLHRIHYSLSQRLRHWYGRFFLLSGYQSVKYVGKASQRVYFLHKIPFYEPKSPHD